MAYNISGIQQLGVGTPDENNSCEYYSKIFGMTTPIFREAAEAPFMTKYTGGKVQSRSATLAVNLQGGSGFEIWQYTSRKTVMPDFQVSVGDLGICMGKIKAVDIKASFQHMKNNDIELLSDIIDTPEGKKAFYMKDNLENLFQVIENDEFFQKGNFPTGGPFGAFIGVSDMDKSLKFYQELLGFDTIVSDETAIFPDLKMVPGGKGRLRRVVIRPLKPATGPFSPVFGKPTIELVQAIGKPAKKIFQNRYWGDGGFIHLCFDITGMEALKAKCKELKHPFTVDSNNSFDMGEAAGHFTYIEDPDGALIEFVETHRIPIMKKWNWYMNLKKRGPEKPLPRWMLKMLKSNKY